MYGSVGKEFSFCDAVNEMPPQITTSPKARDVMTAMANNP